MFLKILFLLFRNHFISLALATTASTLILVLPVSKLYAQTPTTGGAITLRSDVQESNSETGIITAKGNVKINYPARGIQATAAQAQYHSRERRLILTGNVYVLQQGNSMRAETMTYLIDEGRFIATPKSDRQVESTYIVQDANPVKQPQEN